MQVPALLPMPPPSYVTLRFSDPNTTLRVETSLFDNYPHSPVGLMMADLGTIPANEVVSFDQLSLSDFCLIREVLLGRQLESSLAPELWTKADAYSLTKDPGFYLKHHYAQLSKSKVADLEAFIDNADNSSALLIVSAKKYQLLKPLMASHSNIVPCCVLHERQSNTVELENPKLCYRALVIYDKVLVGVNELALRPATGLESEPVDTNQLKHRLLFQDQGLGNPPTVVAPFKIINNPTELSAASEERVYNGCLYDYNLGDLFSDRPERILRGTAACLGGKTGFEGDGSRSHPIYFTEYEDYCSQIPQSTFELKFATSRIVNYLETQRQRFASDIETRNERTGLCYTYYHDGEDPTVNGELISIKNYISYCFVRLDVV
jgi:hypothetical protein